jgi:hypothetical protein
MKKILTPALFSLLSVIGTFAILYSIVLGMSPGVSSLKFTRFFMYGPGLGFFWLVILLLLAIVLQIYARLIKNKTKKLLWNKISWAVLILLLIIEGVMIAEFAGLF